MPRSYSICLKVATIFVLVLFPCIERSLAEPKDLHQPTIPVIRKIEIEVHEIFENEEDSFFYRGANAIKIQTRKDIVERELRFKEGEPFDRFLIDESERALRAVPYLREIKITPTFDGDFVDILVKVQDTWTIFPQISLSSGGGTDKRSIGLAEKNLLGLGKRVELLYADDEGRQKVEGVWDDTRLFGTRQRLLLGHFDRSDGTQSIFNYSLPLRSLADPYSWTITGDHFNLVGRLFDAGDERFIYRQNHDYFGAWYTASYGVPEVKLKRFSFGYEFLQDDFSQATDRDFVDADVDPKTVSRDPSFLAEDRKFSGPFLAYEEIEPDYISLDYIDRFDRRDDYNLGREWRIKLGLAPEVFDSIKNTGIVSSSTSIGKRFSPGSFTRGLFAYSTRVDSDGASNIIGTLDLRYYNCLGLLRPLSMRVGRHTLAGSFTADFGADLDLDKEFIVGAGTGLRGYKDRAFSGNHRLLINLEDRFHLVDNVFQVASLGGAVFFDMGGASRNGLGDILDDRLYSDVGIGLRIGLPASSNGTVVRVDLAFPLRDGIDGTKALEPQLLFTIGQAFSARLRGESGIGVTDTVRASYVP